MQQVERSGKRPPAESLRVIADRAMAMAAHYQPELTDPKTGVKRTNPDYVEERYFVWLTAAREANKAAAPYFTPSLRSVLFGGALGAADSQAKIADPRQTMVQLYLGMRRRGELTAKVIEGPKVAKAVVDEVLEGEIVEDDADGTLT